MQNNLFQWIPIFKVTFINGNFSFRSVLLHLLFKTSNNWHSDYYLKTSQSVQSGYYLKQINAVSTYWYILHLSLNGKQNYWQKVENIWKELKSQVSYTLISDCLGLKLHCMLALLSALNLTVNGLCICFSIFSTCSPTSAT